MTVQELLTMIDTLYPNAESDNTKVSYMNIALNSMAKFFGGIAEDASLVTVADQDEYDYPTGVESASQIISLAVGRSDMPSNRYDYIKIKQAMSEDNPRSYNSYHEVVSASGKRKFVLYPAPKDDGLPIVVRYNKIVPELSATTADDEPQIDRRYHEALAFYAVHMLCAQGASPDVLQANVYMQKYDIAMEELWMSKAIEEKKMKRKYRDNPQWRKYRSYGRGFDDA